jgi:serine/threonine protein kinase
MSEKRYKIYDKLGAGGKGAVYRAYDTQLKRWVAIKRLLSATEANKADPEFEQLRREANTLASLSNANIVTVFDVAVDEEGLFVVMELLQGQDLNDVLAHGPLSVEDFKELAHQTLEALVEAHHLRILHRDIKPENIKVERLSSGRLQAKIIDFGLAREGLTARKQTESGGTVMGSIYYMAPEQLTRRPTDQRTDLYALGCVLYEALSGKKAFDAKSVHEVIEKHINHDMLPIELLCPHLPQWLTYWINRLMAKNPEDRPNSAQQAINELRAWEALPASPNTTGFVPMQYHYTTTGVVPHENYAINSSITPHTVQTATALHTNQVPMSYSSGISPSTTQSNKTVTTRTGLKRQRLTGTTKLIWLLVTLLILLAAGIASLFLKKQENHTSDETVDFSKDKVEELKVSDQLYPADRHLPVLNEERIMHFIAGVNTRGYDKDSDGKYVPVESNNTDVAVWDDITSRGGNTLLKSIRSNSNLSPRLLKWHGKHTVPYGIRKASNVYAMDFAYSSIVPLVMRAQSEPDMRKFFPFGDEPSLKRKGVTLGAVFLADSKRVPMRLLCLSDTDNLCKVSVSILADGKLVVDFENGRHSANSHKQIQLTDVDTKLPVFFIATWSEELGVTVFAKNSFAKQQRSRDQQVPVPQVPLTDLVIGSDSQVAEQCFHGYLSELVVYSTALDNIQSSLLMKLFVQVYEQKTNVKR